VRDDLFRRGDERRDVRQERKRLKNEYKQE
jgi:hypothetical protein